MARPRLVIPISNGNWSDPAIWSSGELPTQNDVVALNGKTITVDTDVNAYRILNSSENPLAYNSYTYMTSNTAPEGIAESSLPLPDSVFAWYPFSNANNYQPYPSPSVSNPRWWTYEYPNQEPIILSEYRFNGLDNNHPYNPKTWKFQGWNNVSQSWEDLDSQVNNTSYSYTYVGSLSSNTTAYYKYRIIVYEVRSSGSAVAVMYVKFFQKGTYISSTYTTPGGSMLVTDSCDINVATYVMGDQSVNMIDCNIDVGETVNFNTDNYINRNSNYSTISLNGSGTYNINGDFLSFAVYSQRNGWGVKVNSGCVLNIIGNIKGGDTSVSYASALYITSNPIVNVIGNVTGSNGYQGSSAIWITGGCTLNITGNVSGTDFVCEYGSVGISCSNANANITIVGNVYGGPIKGYNNNGSAYRDGIIIYNANSLSVTGGVFAGTSYYPTSPESRFEGIVVSSIKELIIIGVIQANNDTQGLSSSISSTYMLTVPGNFQFSGPFISSAVGVPPFNMPYLKLIFNAGNYYQFIDTSSNNTSLVSPASIIDSPSPSDVRSGTSYANGNFTGTLIVPPVNRVSLGIPVDDTVGTAVLTADDVWNAQTSAMNTDGSIGKRLKNASTVDTTGDQLTSLL